MAIDLSNIMSMVNQLKMMRSSLEGRQAQLQSQLNNQLLPEFEKLGVTPDTIEDVIRVEESEMKSAYKQIQDTINEVNRNLSI